MEQQAAGGEMLAQPLVEDDIGHMASLVLGMMLGPETVRSDGLSSSQSADREQRTGCLRLSCSRQTFVEIH